MRSSTARDLPGRCPTCWVRQAHCICAAVPRVSCRTALLVVRHEREAAKSTGTARIAQLALPSLSIVDYGDSAAEAGARLSASDHLDGGWLLFPSDAPAPWPAGPVRCLVLLDGTWRQTRKMLKKLPSLARLPRLMLPPKAAEVLRLREAPFESGRSTLEAVADALRLLEGAAVADPLEALHTAYVERVFKARGVWGLKRA
jgi:DTW domain-containing protein YfiP